MERWADLHAHTSCSDGTDTPEELVALAAARGVTLLAVTDHNVTDGVGPARLAGARAGVAVLPAAEFDAACERGELHLLAYGIDPDAPAMRRLLERADRAGREHNLRLLENLERAGYALDIRTEDLNGSQFFVAIRTALIGRGYAGSSYEAYTKFMGNPMFAPPRCQPAAEEILAAVAESGGLASLAHPCKLQIDDETTVSALAEAGLWGIEAYYGDRGGPEYLARALELAGRYALHPTIGSDYHGPHRSSLGMRVPEDPALRETLDLLADRT